MSLDQDTIDNTIKQKEQQVKLNEALLTEAMTRVRLAQIKLQESEKIPGQMSRVGVVTSPEYKQAKEEADAAALELKTQRESLNSILDELGQLYKMNSGAGGSTSSRSKGIFGFGGERVS